MSRFFLIIWGIIIPSLVFCFTEQEVQTVSSSKQWLKLLHYRQSYFRKFKSEEDLPSFFFSPDGKTSPYNELRANLQAFQIDVTDNPNQHAQCRFPARYRFLKEKLKLDFKDINCSELTTWLTTINGDSITLISANSYPQNPISTFGHTFLRINSNRSSDLQLVADSKKMDLLDYSIGFAADSPPSITGFSYIAKGVFGGFNGHFSVVPYYLKTKEYNNLESRDIWEYDLNFTKEETHQLMLHLWELGDSASFDYYFFDENCSYQILTLLDVLRDELNLAEEFPVYTPPMETVKVIANKYHLVTNIKYRPSLYTKMKLSQGKLSSSDKQLLKKMTDDKKLIQESNNPEILEALIAYYTYLKQKESHFYKKADDQKYYLALRKRAEFASATNNNNTILTEKNSPHKSHDTKLINLSLGYWRSKEQFFYQDLKFSAAYHDYLSQDAGYPAFSKFDILSFKLRYINQHAEVKQRLSIQELSPLEIVSLLPLTDIDQAISWAGELKYLSPLEDERSHVYKAGGRIGVSKLAGITENSLFFSLFGPEVQYAPTENKIVTNLNLQSGIIIPISETFKLSGNYILNYNLFNRSYKFYHQPNIILSQILNKNLELRLNSTYLNRNQLSSMTDVKIELMKYF